MHLGENDPFYTLSPAGVPSQYSGSMLDKRASNALVTGEDEQSERVAMADCAAPTIDLLTLWGRWRGQLYIVRERCTLSVCSI